MASKSLKSFAELTTSIQRAATGGYTFNFEEFLKANTNDKGQLIIGGDIRVAPNTGNVGYRVTCANGKVITFWSHKMTEVIEAIDDEGNFSIIPGTKVLEDGALLSKGDAEKGGFWK